MIDPIIFQGIIRTVNFKNQRKTGQNLNRPDQGYRNKDLRENVNTT